MPELEEVSVLVIDDDADTREIVADALLDTTRMYPTFVATAEDQAAALSKAETVLKAAMTRE